MYRITAPDDDVLKINLPASKSVTHRILILGALNRGRTIISEPLISEDTRITMQALKNMGAIIASEGNMFTITGPIGKVNQPAIFLGNSGSSARFLMPLAMHLDHPFRFYGSERLHQRPFKELFEALYNFNVKVECEKGTLPAVIYPRETAGGIIELNDLPSSQIITALMMTALWMKNDLEIHMPENTPSLPYIKMTYKLMKRLGLKIEYDKHRIHVTAETPNFDWNLTVEKDLSAVSYWVVLSLIHQLKLILPKVTLPSLQGDERIFEIASTLGAKIMLYEDRLEFEGKIERGMNIDCNEIPDLVPALSVLAMFASHKSHLTNIKHLEYKESNRIEAIQKNIAALGGKSVYENGNLQIIPQTSYQPAQLDSFDDHRIAMSFAVAGTRIPGTTISHPQCVEKSYPSFWQDFRYWQEADHD